MQGMVNIMSELFNVYESEKQEEKIIKYKVKIKSCALCLFATEITDTCNDLIGYSCTISDNILKMSDEEWCIAASCPLRNIKHIIELEIEK